MSVLLVLGFAAVLDLTAPQSAARPQASAQAPASTEIGDEPGVLTGHGPIRNTPVPGVRFRTAAPDAGEPAQERRLGGDPPIPIPFPGPGSGSGPTPSGPNGSGSDIPMTKGDEPGVIRGGTFPPRPPR
jgi:hypothetical protein